MANYIYATEQDAYNIGNSIIQKGTGANPIANKLCTVNRAHSFGCCLTKQYDTGCDADSPISDTNVTGESYSNGTKLVLKADLSYDPGIINASSRTVGFSIGDISPINSNGVSQVTLKSCGRTASTLRTDISDFRVILSTSTYGSPTSINWGSVEKTNSGNHVAGDWTLAYVNNNYYLILQGGKAPSNSVFSKDLKFLSGSGIASATCNITFGNSAAYVTQGSNAVAVYANIRFTGYQNNDAYVYIMNIPIGTTSSVTSSNIFYYSTYNAQIGTQVGQPYLWQATSQNI